MFKVFKVQGNSMLPNYQAGDYVVALVWKLFDRTLKMNDIAVINHTTHGIIIKRIASIQTKTKHKTFFAESINHKEGLSSNSIGEIPHKSIVGRVIWHIPKT